MTETRPTEQLPLILPQTTKEEKRRLRRFSVLSAFAHAAALAMLMTWTGGKARVLPPAQVITVDLGHMELPKQQSRPRQVQPLPGSVPLRLPTPAKPVRSAPEPAPFPVAAKPQPAMRTVAETPAASTPVTAGSAGSAGPSAEIPSKAAVETMTGRTGPAGPAQPATMPTLPYVPAQNRGVDKAGIRVSYLQRCRGLIDRHKEYPVMARKGRIEGTVVIRGTLARNGSLRECIINRSSGSSLLDNAALRAVRSVGQFPPLPPELQGVELVFELPVSFRLSSE